MEEDTKDTKYQKCAGCNTYLHKVSGYKKILDTNEDLLDFHYVFKKTVDLNVKVCSKCYSKIRLASHENSKKSACNSTKPSDLQETFSESPFFESQSSTQSSASTDGSVVVYVERKWKQEEELVEMPIQRTISTHAYCFICKCKKEIIQVPNQARLQVYAHSRIYIPAGNKCCHRHLIKNRFYQDQLNSIVVYSPTSTIPVTELSKLLEQLSIRVDAQIHDRVGDFTLPEERLKVLTGLSWDNIIELRCLLTSLHDSSSRNVTQALVTFLFKLVSGNSNKIICAVLGLEREQQVSDFSNSILKSFEKDVLPTRFGIGALSREELISHNTPVAKALHNIKDDQLALIADGTYLRHEKSSNNNYQRKSFSGQKKVPLCKPFTICALDGYIVDSAGPFEANLNDAHIMEFLMQDPNGLKKLLQENDIWVVDRGFRDVKEKLVEMGYQVLMPVLKGKRSQLTTEESNCSRFVTAIRWPVEVVHGVIGNKYKLLRHKFYNTMLPKAGLYCKVACFLQNKFGKRFVTDPSLTDEIVSRMIQQKNVENTLALEVETNRWSRKKIPFQRITSNDLSDFPELTERDLKIFFTGTYQLQQSISYLAEMINEQDGLDLYYLKQTNEILKVQVRSRHISRKTYNCYIHYRPNATGYGSIVRHFCECANGNRTIGSCAHIAAVIYYLSYGRYLSEIVKPAEILSSIFAIEKVSPIINENSDED